MRATSWDVLVAVAAGGAVGAVARHGVGVAWPTPDGGFPWATVLVNLTGCAAFGAVVELLTRRPDPHRLARPFVGTGVLGGFTTFSLYAVEARELLGAGRAGLAAAYVVGTLVGAVAAVWAGRAAVRLPAGRESRAAPAGAGDRGRP